MSDETIVQPNTYTYKDADGIDREFTDPDWWYAERGTLKALGRTPEGAVAMLDRMEGARRERA